MSPRTAEANEALLEERRASILDAALLAFVERGYEGTRIQEIATRCDLSYGLVYRYFPSKEAIFSTLVEQALGAAAFLVGTLPPAAPPEAIGTFVGFAVADPSPRYFSLIVEALTNQGVPPALAEKARETLRGFIASLAAACGGATPAAAAARAESLLAILLGASILKLCRLSAGDFAPAAAMSLSSPGKD